MNIRVQPIEVPVLATEIEPERSLIAKAVETEDPKATVSALAIQGFNAANPTAQLETELVALEAKAGRRGAERARTLRARDEYGQYVVHAVAPFSATAGLMTALPAIFAIAIYFIEMLALWYAQTVYVAQAAFFDKIADDILLSLPYTAVVLFGAPVVFGIGVRQRNDIRQSRFAVRAGSIGLACLTVYLLMLGLMSSGLLTARSPHTGWVAFALIVSHGPASIAMGAALGLFLHLKRQDSGTQQIVRGEGYEHGDGLLKACEAEEFGVINRIGELKMILSVIAAKRAACEAAWLAELADIQADLTVAAAVRREQRRQEIHSAAQSAALLPSIPSLDVSNTSLAVN